ncbi:ornithine carbamoyltransferase [Heliorestis acidaminivorans]|uniref:Ornithine carbamoyltransferase n=1 Tax=Heliorestis acidaminivorans TaxID=553427 RepID=A0A6I0ERM2_9FIRM|nr:ornithine carbamoyltransferase [Heliorestis acidaminivorans]KAB2951371.1 ornithine carbamoyltransferase [Heliorestis acidaminivorans]
MKGAHKETLPVTIDENLRGRDFLSLHDFSRQEIEGLLKLAQELKGLQKAGKPHPLLEGKTLGMIFTKSSTRTRVSFEVGMYQLGGHALFLSGQDIQIGRGEPISDTARVLSRYVDGIMIRTFAHQDVVELAKYADIPVINGLTDLLHPCQVLADLLTIVEYKGRTEGLKITYIGDGNNMAHEIMFGGAITGMDVVICTPEGYEPSEEIYRLASEDAKQNGGSITLIKDPLEASRNADILYTDVWASMGQEEEAQKRIKAFQGYQINEELLKVAQKDAIVLHCLPAHRGEEITHEVIEGPQSAVFDQAENRLHAQKAIMAATM